MSELNVPNNTLCLLSHFIWIEPFLLLVWYALTMTPNKSYIEHAAGYQVSGAILKSLYMFCPKSQWTIQCVMRWLNDGYRQRQTKPLTSTHHIISRLGITVFSLWCESYCATTSIVVKEKVRSTRCEFICTQLRFRLCSGVLLGIYISVWVRHCVWYQQPYSMRIFGQD